MLLQISSDHHNKRREKKGSISMIPRCPKEGSDHVILDL